MNPKEEINATTEYARLLKGHLASLGMNFTISATAIPLSEILDMLIVRLGDYYKAEGEK